MILGISRTSGVPHPKDQGIQVAGWVLQVGGDVNNLADGVTSLGQWGIRKEEYFPCFTSCIPRASCCLSYQFIASLVVWIWPIAGLYHTPWQIWRIVNFNSFKNRRTLDASHSRASPGCWTSDSPNPPPSQHEIHMRWAKLYTQTWTPAGGSCSRAPQGSSTRLFVAGYSGYIVQVGWRPEHLKILQPLHVPWFNHSSQPWKSGLFPGSALANKKISDYCWFQQVLYHR